MKSLHRRFFSLERNFQLFIAATILTGLGLAVDNSIFNNYLKEVYQLSEGQRTFLEFPRELPGFLVFFFLGLLVSLGDLRIAALANLAVGVGMFGLGLIPPVYGLMLFVVFIYSSGQHIYMALGNSLGMAFARPGQLGKRLGQLGALNTGALVTGSLIILGLFHLWKPPYWVLFTLGAGSYALASLCLFLMHQPREKKKGTHWIWRREYGLFYLMSVVFGARKQLFLTFAPWVLVAVFHRDVGYMTTLVLVICTLGIFLRPWIGRLIDQVGERRVLGAEALILTVVCLVWAWVPSLGNEFLALAVATVCFVVDQSSSSVGMARATYLKKILVQESDLSPTLGLGITLDHVAAMGLPILGGLLWEATGPEGYRWVFLLGAGVALANFFITRRIKVQTP